MLLANCVRRINKIDISKCVNKSISSFTRQPNAVASHSANTVRLVVNRSLPNVTSMTTLFTNHYQNNGHLYGTHRYYSSNSRRDDSDDEDHLIHHQRQLPRFERYYKTTPSVYLMLKNALSTLLIRSYFDQQFNRDEFLSGAKQAVEVNVQFMHLQQKPAIHHN